MNQFLRTSELKSIVCDELLPDKESLLALALSSRAWFFDPVMDKLWRRMDSFDPLLACLPEDVWREEEKVWLFSGSKRFLVLPNDERPITPGDLTRFELYAGRIKAFHFRHKKVVKMLSVEFMESLRAVTSGQFGVLAPELQSFTWTPDEPRLSLRGDLRLYEEQFQPSLSLFISGKVASLTLPNMQDSPDNSVATLAARLPSLEHLSLKGADLDFAANIIKSAPWKKLQSLILRRISDDIILHLAALPRLTSLKVKYLMAITGQYASAVSASSASFNYLKELDIPCDHLETAAKFLEYFPRSSGIHVLKFSAEAGSSPSVSQDIINLVSDRVERSTLETLVLRDNEVPDTGAEPTDVEPIADHNYAVIDMSPLSTFPNLKTLVLSFGGRVQVTPADVFMITSSWPRLENLDLCGTYPITRPPLLDHTHLFQIAVGCPRLRTLGLPFDAAGLTGTERSAHGPFMRLTFLHLAGSLVNYPACVAAFFLRTNFPNAQLDPTYNSFVISTEPHWKRWFEVQRALSMHDPIW